MPDESTLGVDIEGNASDHGQDTPSEETPLLPNDLPAEIVPPKSFQRRVILMCILCLFIVEVSAFVMEPPTQKIMEDIICRDYYPDHALRLPRIQDGRCKDNNVQKALAMVRGWSLAVEMATPIISQFPFGIIADKYGRRPVLFLALLGCFLQTAWVMMILLFPNIFSIWAMLPGSLFFLIGGGGPMAGAMVWTILADIVPAAERTSVFYQITAIGLLINVVVNPISAFLMSYDPWIAMWLGLGFLLAGTLSVLLIPETLQFRQSADAKRRNDSEHQDGNSISSRQEETEEDDLAIPKQGVLRQAWFTVKNDMGHVWRFIFASRSIMVLIVSFAAFVLIKISLLIILLQYMTKRFEWDWSEATYISTVGILTTIVCLLAILPLASALISKVARFGPLRRDLLLSRVSMVLVTVGLFVLSLASAPWLFVSALILLSLGNGFAPLCRALLSGVVEPHTIATLNTTISLLELLMSVIGGPLMGWLLSRGMELGGAWQGLPFLVTTAIALAVTVGILAFKIPAGVAQAHSS